MKLSGTAPSARSFVLAVTMTALGGVGGWQVVVWPAFAQKAALEASLRDERQRVVHALSAYGSLPRLREQADMAGAQARRLAQQIVQVPDAATVLEMLIEIARSERVELTEFRPRPPVASSTAPEMPAEITLRGNYHDLVRFLRAATAAPALVSIADVRVTASQRDDGQGSVSATLVASTHEVSAFSSQPGEHFPAAEDAFEPLPDDDYDGTLKRDPFVPLVRPVRAPEPVQPKPRGPGRTLPAASDVIVRGVVRHRAEWLAILETPGGRSMTVRVSDRLADASVTSVDAGGVTLHPDRASGDAPPLRKPLIRLAAERR